MRAFPLLATLFLASCAIVDPRVTAPVSHQDVTEIAAALHAATSERILSIDPVYTSKPTPGSTRQQATELGPIQGGKVQTKPMITYLRTDRVLVRTGSERNLTGGVYEVQRVGDTWKIVVRSSWIH